jgi:hypothetical protein
MMHTELRNSFIVVFPCVEAVGRWSRSQWPSAYLAG